MTSDRYSTDGSVEAKFQPGSRQRVLLNRLGISRVREMQQAESDELRALLRCLLLEVDEHQRFTEEGLSAWHRRWLGSIYVWAGDYRQVNMAKGGFQFATSALIPKLMQSFEREVLAQHTPCFGMDSERLVRALAITHAEFILVHPFREGNGRLARLLNTLMGLQAGIPALDYGGIRGERKRAYIAAIHAALDRNYAPLESVFHNVLRRTLRGAKA